MPLQMHVQEQRIAPYAPLESVSLTSLRLGDRGEFRRPDLIRTAKLQLNAPRSAWHSPIEPQPHVRRA